ncbi:precorrin-8X methylmutase [Anabaena azotica FACHB-119]|uniref:Precorrin-8X methylmutase n=2 Tax=Anabaena azotica TaxID=197653 RepID=A0ABR8DBX8_9NOST|nr:precorrin-8X methylmutase [Anabaena azotica FACHB-119]
MPIPRVYNLLPASHGEGVLVLLSAFTPCPGLFYATPAQDGILSRIRIPGGMIDSKQCQAIADIADQYGGGYIDVTNRANIQIREIRGNIDSPVLKQLQDLGLGASNTGVDQIRNIMTSPTAGIDKHELIDTRPFVKTWDNYINEHSALAGLSAKFSVCFDGGGLSVSDRPNDITFIAILVDGSVYFRLCLSMGAKGTPPVDTGILLSPTACLPVLAALADVYLAHSDISSQRQPRLREVINSIGLNSYLQEAEKRLPFALERKNLTPLPPSLQGKGEKENHYSLPRKGEKENHYSPLLVGEGLGERSTNYHHIGIHPQRQQGLYYIGIVLPLGRLDTKQLRGLAQLSSKYGSGIRLTPWQNLLLTDIAQAQLTDVQNQILGLGLDFSPANIQSGLVACSGNQGCAAAATDTKGHALALADYLQSLVTLEQPVNIHFSGCEKSCAQHNKGDITLLGVNYGTGERYQVFVGGGDSKDKFGHQLYQDVAVAELPTLIERILKLYKSQQLNPDECLGKFAHRYGYTQLKQLLSRPNPMSDYIRNANEIYRHSFAIIRSEANLDILPPDIAKVAVRLIHACGMTDIVTDLGYSTTAAQAGRAALAAGAPILCDCRMVADGVTRRRLPANNEVICTLNEPQVPELAQKLGNTRSAAALELWKPHIRGAVVAIGNAPTALFRLLEMLDAGCPKPAVILGFPVGFVGAAESKAVLAADSRNVPFMTLHGRRGGSAIAAAAVNALATEEE